MKKIILLSMIGLALISAGCTSTVSQNDSQSTTDTNQNTDTEKPTDSMADWKTYQAEDFSLKYPAYLLPEVNLVGVRTTVSFLYTPAEGERGKTFEVASMPNQGASTLDEWVNELISQTGLVKKESIKISGQTAYVLTMPETGNGNEYLFLSQDSRTMFEITFNNFDRDLRNSVFSSFLLIE